MQATTLAAVLVGVLLSACASSPPPAGAEAPIVVDAPVAKLEDPHYIHYAIGVHIDAPSDRIWALLTDADAYPDWNSAVMNIDGDIAPGGKIAVRTKVAPKRTFKLHVTDVEPGRRMIWQDGGKAFRGVRTFELVEREDGSADFTMKEQFTGTLLPKIKKHLPDLTEHFQEFAGDLKRAAEAPASG